MKKIVIKQENNSLTYTGLLDVLEGLRFDTDTLKISQIASIKSDLIRSCEKHLKCTFIGKYDYLYVTDKNTNKDSKIISDLENIVLKYGFDFEPIQNENGLIGLEFCTYTCNEILDFLELNLDKINIKKEKFNN